jgi:branched-chain amino acid transport system substrate-binding protein
MPAFPSRQQRLPAVRFPGSAHRLSRLIRPHALLLLALAAALGAAGGPAQAQAPARIGASLSKTGGYATLGQNQLRGYQLCVKHANEKGGVLGRPIELIVEDDNSQSSNAVAIYERLIVRSKVDAVLGPYSSPITEAVADVVEKHRMPMVAAGASATSIFRKGRRFAFMVYSPAESYLEGLIDIAAKRGLKSVAILHEETLFPIATATGAGELAAKRGLQVVFVGSYPKGTTDFGPLLKRVRAANPDVIAAATYFDDAVAISRQLKESDLSPKAFGVTVGGDLQQFYDALGAMGEFVYGASQWDTELVTLRAGGLVPIARLYPGAAEFVDAYRKEHPGLELSYHSAAGYGGCQVLLESIRRADSTQGEKVRDVLLKLQINTVLGEYRVDQGGFQVGHRMVLFQWQDGKKVIVWPEDIAPGRPRIPTPPWSQRK